jgi:hypothetical protein
LQACRRQGSAAQPASGAARVHRLRVTPRRPQANLFLCGVLQLVRTCVSASSTRFACTFTIAIDCSLIICVLEIVQCRALPTAGGEWGLRLPTDPMDSCTKARRSLKYIYEAPSVGQDR